MDELRVAIIGYGLAGQTFHAPLVAATDGLRVAVVVTSSAQRAGQAAMEHPGVVPVPRPDDLWQRDDIDLVVVATPNDAHVRLATAAIDRGLPVVVDKPLAVSSADARALVDHANEAGIALTVFQNRRWDSDHLTLRRLLDGGRLGTVLRYESRFERWRPEPRPEVWREATTPEQGGGLLLDLGSHLIDQALQLFGPVESVYAQIAARRGGPADDDAFVVLNHASGPVSHLSMSALAAAPGPRLRVLGTEGAFTVTALDSQEDALRGGARPDTEPDWGREPAYQRGRLFAGEQSVPLDGERGDWPRFYALVRDAVRDGATMPVDPSDAVATLMVIEAARRSAQTGQVVSCG